MDRRRHVPLHVVGRYAVFDVIAMGGMATVHFGRLLGPSGFSRTVVIKRLHAQYASDAEFATMFLDEARVAARIRHPNVVAVVDVAAEAGEILLVMEYVHGESLAYLTRAQTRRESITSAHNHAASQPRPARLRLIGNVMAGALQGLHAAHEATGDNGRPLGVVHRDFSPQNILVGVDGTARVADFGVAKAEGQTHCTGVGQVKGKIRYLSPEQVTCGDVDRRSDLWAASVVLWEALSGRRLFSGEHDAGVLMQVLQKPIPPLSEVAPEVPDAVSRIVMRGLERDRTRRFATALEMATALEDAVGLLPPRHVGAWVEKLAHGRLDERRRVLDDIEAETPASTIGTLRVEGAAAHAPAAQAVGLDTDIAMVRTSLPEAERPTMNEHVARASRITWAAPLRAPVLRWVAWTAATTLVMAIGGGVAAQLLGHAPRPTVIASAAPAPPPDAEAETASVVCVSATATPAPAPTSSARTEPARRVYPYRARTLPGDPVRQDLRPPAFRSRE
jgi:tRNA A-37 threonylcarbamoyl transferase component Bud32